MHNAGNTLHNPVTLTFDLGTAGSVHAKDLPYSMRVPSIVLIAQVVFLFDRGQTDTHMPLIILPTHIG